MQAHHPSPFLLPSALPRSASNLLPTLSLSALAGTAEVARRLGVGPATVARLRALLATPRPATERIHASPQVALLAMTPNEDSCVPSNRLATGAVSAPPRQGWRPLHPHPAFKRIHDP